LICKVIVRNYGIFIGMKLIKTIEKLISEAEDLYFEASQKPINQKELTKLEKNLINSQDLLKRFNKLKGKS
jgi:hypothetical protein